MNSIEEYKAVCQSASEDYSAACKIHANALCFAITNDHAAAKAAIATARDARDATRAAFLSAMAALDKYEIEISTVLK